MNERTNGLVGVPDRTILHFRIRAKCEFNDLYEDDDVCSVILRQLDDEGYVMDNATRVAMLVDPTTAEEYEVGSIYDLDIAMERVYE